MVICNKKTPDERPMDEVAALDTTGAVNTKRDSCLIACAIVMCGFEAGQAIAYSEKARSMPNGGAGVMAEEEASWVENEGIEHLWISLYHLHSK